MCRTNHLLCSRCGVFLEHPVLLMEKCLSEMCGSELDMAYVTDVHGCKRQRRMVL